MSTIHGLLLDLDLERTKKEAVESQLYEALERGRSLADQVQTLNIEAVSRRREMEIEVAAATERELTSRGDLVTLETKLAAEMEAKARIEESLTTATAEVAMLRRNTTMAEEQVGCLLGRIICRYPSLFRGVICLQGSVLPQTPESPARKQSPPALPFRPESMISASFPRGQIDF